MSQTLASARGPMPRFDVAVVNYNTDFYLHNLLASLRRALPAEAVGAVHVWDNASTDASLQVLEEVGRDAPWLRVHRSPFNTYHGPAIDALLRVHAEADWVLLLDSDTEVRRNFVDDLSSVASDPVAFVGQIHPQMPHLYAYLAHLFVYRPWYRDLPPFRHHGAPGIEFFRFIEEQEIPFRRFRWRDYIHHYGQGTIRGVYEREEKTNAFYRFAARESAMAPGSREASLHHDRLRRTLAEFLATRSSREPALAVRPDRAGTDGAARHGANANAAASRETSSLPSRATPATSGRQPTPLRYLGAALSSPVFAWSHRKARKIGLRQKPDEIRRLFALVRKLRPRRLLELGTAHGGSLYLWTRAAARDAKLISVDLPPWESDDPWEAHKLQLFQTFARPSQRLVCIRGDSHAAQTARKVTALLDGQPLDFLFLDGDPSYRGVKADFHDYSRLVGPGGLIAIHGIHRHSKGWGGEVPRFWDEIESSHPTIRLIADPSQDGSGIGVIFVK